MAIWAILLIFFVLAAWMICRQSLYVYISYVKNAETDTFQLTVLLFNRIKIYRMTKKAAIESQLKEQTHKYKEKLRDKQTGAPPMRAKKKEKRGARLNINYYKLLLDRFVCQRLRCRIRLHGGDADKTALLFGAAHVSANLMLCALRRRIRFLREPEILIYPEFQRKKNEFEFECICSAKIGNLISIIKKYMTSSMEGIT